MAWTEEQLAEPRRKRDEVLAAAKEKAQQKLPCGKCGSSAIPIQAAPEKGSASWWDDPSVYIGCADCGAYLADLEIVSPFMWMPERRFVG